MKNSIKRSILSLLTVAALMTAGEAAAQMKTAYFMEGSVQRLDMNAAFVPQRGFVNIPGIGNLGAGYTSNAFSVKNFLYPNPDGNGLVTFMHSSVDADKFLRRLRNKNHFDASIRENLFGFGGFARRYFWSFNINLRSETTFTIPKQFFRLAKEMEEGTYNLDNFHANTDNYLEFAIGFAFPIRILSKDVTIGFRAKALAGAAHATLDVDNMRVRIDDEEWRADMRGTLTGNIIGMDFSKLMGRTSFSDIKDCISGFSSNRIGSWGLAFDLGADTRFFDDRLKVSLGLNDLGFIAWSKKSAVNGTFDDLSVAFKGYNIKPGDTEADFIKPDSLTVNITAPHGSTKMLTATLNIGGEYTFLDNRIGLGLLSQTRFYNDYTSTEITVSANFRPVYWFSASLSHSMLHNRMGAFGLALNAHPSWINFFIGMDYIGFNYAKYKDIECIPRNLNSVNFYFGLAVPITKPKRHSSFPETLPRRR